MIQPYNDHPERCRYLRKNAEQCTGEAIDLDSPVLLCSKHGGRFMQYVNTRTAEVKAAKLGQLRRPA